MKYQITNVIKRIGLAVAVALLAVSGLSVISMSHAGALSISSPNDCNFGAVMYCGADSTQALISKYNNGDGHNTVKSLHDIYNFYGIDSAGIQAMNTTAVAGRVSADGHVFVDGNATPVASNALTGGRGNLPGSTKVTSNGTTFYTRPPSIPFTSSMVAYVAMKDGVFQFALFATCGNPVKATPTPKPAPKPTPTTPAYSVTKFVALKGDTNFTSDAQVTPGSHVVYRVTVKSSGTGPVTNLKVNDTLPAGVTFVNGSFSLDGTNKDDTAANSFFGGGLLVGTLNTGASVVFEFEAVVGSSDTSAQCTPQTLNNVAHTIATSLPPGTATASVHETCPGTPQCTNLAITKGDHMVTVNSVTTQLSGATVQSATIDWGDGTSTTPVSDVSQLSGQTHTYSGDGPFTIIAHLAFNQNGHIVNSSGDICQASVNFTSPPPVTPPTVTPAVTTVAAPQPTSLVNTGPGSILGVAAVVAAFATFAHRYWTVRRLHQDGGAE